MFISWKWGVRIFLQNWKIFLRSREPMSRSWGYFWQISANLGVFYREMEPDGAWKFQFFKCLLTPNGQNDPKMGQKLHFMNTEGPMGVLFWFSFFIFFFWGLKAIFFVIFENLVKIEVLDSHKLVHIRPSGKNKFKVSRIFVNNKIAYLTTKKGLNSMNLSNWYQ